ncbi:MAG: ribonuclease III [Bdellovibrionales bacterium]|nr:ribonuclease III [Bdellovibrionales bacterium]
MAVDLELFQEKLRYQAKNPELLKTALCHKSFSKENPGWDDNEKLEFLGDAVLDVVISDLLMQRYQEDKEGSLSRKRASLVNEDRLYRIARLYYIPSFILLGEAEKQNNLQENPRIVASAFEAIVGAIYFDRGFQAAFDWLEEAFAYVLEVGFSSHDFEKDYKTRFQEWVQEKFKQTPYYKVVSQTGPDHARVFQVEVWVNEEMWGQGEGNSKKSAAQDAARVALEKAIP